MPESLFVVISSSGPQRDRSLGVRAQPFWDEHAAFIDALVEGGFIVLGGPFPDEGGAMIVVRAETESDVRSRLDSDPWYQHDILRLTKVRRWELFVQELCR